MTQQHITKHLLVMQMGVASLKAFVNKFLDCNKLPLCVICMLLMTRQDLLDFALNLEQ